MESINKIAPITGAKSDIGYYSTRLFVNDDYVQQSKIPNTDIDLISLITSDPYKDNIVVVGITK